MNVKKWFVSYTHTFRFIYVVSVNDSSFYDIVERLLINN